jgi:hypothetical protein
VKLPNPRNDAYAILHELRVDVREKPLYICRSGARTGVTSSPLRNHCNTYSAGVIRRDDSGIRLRSGALPLAAHFVLFDRLRSHPRQIVAELFVVAIDAVVAYRLARMRGRSAVPGRQNASEAQNSR